MIVECRAGGNHHVQLMDGFGPRLQFRRRQLILSFESGWLMLLELNPGQQHHRVRVGSGTN